MNNGNVVDCKFVVSIYIVHVGQPSTFEAVRLVEIARGLGATEFAALTPYYLKSTDDAIFDYFQAVSDAVGDGRLYVYIYPARSGNTVSPELLVRLAALPNIVGTTTRVRMSVGTPSA